MKVGYCTLIKVISLIDQKKKLSLIDQNKKFKLFLNKWW